MGIFFKNKNRRFNRWFVFGIYSYASVPYRLTGLLMFFKSKMILIYITGILVPEYLWEHISWQF